MARRRQSIRAAAALLIMLGRTYVYPIDVLVSHLELAARRLRELRPLYADLGGEEWAAAIDGEVAVLEACIASDRKASTPVAPPGWERFFGR